MLMETTAQKKLVCHTFGCRFNQNETEKMAAGLRPFGFERVNENESTDLYLINTCTLILTLMISAPIQEMTLPFVPKFFGSGRVAPGLYALDY